MKKIFSFILLMILLVSNIATSNALNTVVKTRNINDTLVQEDSDYTYYDSIKWGYEAGIFDGYNTGNNQGKFVPENNVTRAEFLAMLFKVLQLNVGTEYDKNCFTDSKVGIWYNKLLCYSKEKGYVNGYGNGIFKPNDNIKVYEAEAILYNSFGVTNNTTSNFSKYGNTKLTNIDSSKWYYEKIITITNNGILYKNDGQTDEDYGRNLKRGEMMNLLYQFYGVMNSQQITTNFINNLKDKKGAEMFNLLDKPSQELEVDSSRYQRIVSSLPIIITSIKYKGGLYYNGLDRYNSNYEDSQLQKFNRKAVGSFYTIGFKLGTLDSTDLITKDIELVTNIDNNGNWNIHIDKNRFFDAIYTGKADFQVKGCGNSKAYGFLGFLLISNNIDYQCDDGHSTLLNNITKIGVNNYYLFNNSYSLTEIGKTQTNYTNFKIQ